LVLLPFPFREKTALKLLVLCHSLSLSSANVLDRKSVDEGAATLVVAGFDPGLNSKLLSSVPILEIWPW
jgi:hypothetical protein